MKRDVLIGIAVFFIVFTTYVMTSAPTVVSCGDSAELVTASYTLGVTHGPGYPLYTLLGKLFSMIASGRVTQRYAIFTAFFGSLAVMNTFFILLLFTGKRFLSFAGALVLSFSYHFWLFSLIPEVSALNVFFFSLLTLIFLKWVCHDFRPQSLFLMLFCFVFGSGMSHHYTIVLLLPGFAYYIFVKRRQLQFTYGQLVFFGILFALGLLPYIYLPLSAERMPFMNAGGIDSLSRFLVHIMRKGSATTLSPYYAEFSLENTLSILQFYWHSLLRSFFFPGVLLGIAGFYLLYIRDPDIGIALISDFLLAGPIFFIIARVPPSSAVLKGSLERFLMPSMFLFSIGVGFGIAVSYDLLKDYIRDSRHFRKVSPVVISSVLIAVLPIGFLVGNYKRVDLSNFRLCEVYGMDLLRSLDENSIVLINGDNSLFTLWYLQRVEGMRPDLKILNANVADYHPKQLRCHFPDLVMPDNLAGSEFARELMILNCGKYKIYEVGIPGNEFGGFGLAGNPFVIQPKGLAMQVVKKFDIGEDDDRIWNSFEFRKEEFTKQQELPYFAQEIIYLYAIAHYNKAVIYGNNGISRIAYEEAKKAFDLDPSFVPAKNMMRRLEGKR